LLLHIGGASTASIITTIVVIFFLIFAISFAFGPIPEGQRRFGSETIAAWFKASLPRLIVAGVFSGLLLAGALLSGDNGSSATSTSTCDTGVPPLTGQAATDERLLFAIDGTEKIADAARRGDLIQVQALFAGETHNVMHDIDAPLRAADPSLAKDLCLSVVVVENQMVNELDAEVIARESDQIATYLRAARDLLDLPNTTPDVVIGVPSYCDQPLGAVTDQQLTDTRLRDAADALREAATAFEEGRNEDAQALFYSDAHDVTHDIDGPLRAVDTTLAKKLCEEIVVIETQVATTGVTDAAPLVVAANAAADDIEAAGRALGILE
jgi:hypothetical protein